MSTDEQRAIEFGEYLAKAAEQFMGALDAQYIASDLLEINDKDSAKNELEDELYEADMDASGSRRQLLESIYEFRKRAEKCVR